MTKRLGIFQMHDDKGVVSNYIYHLLGELAENVSHLVIVCNGEVEQEGMERLRTYTQDVFVREDEGFDGTAFKDVMTNLYGWDKVLEFDELVLVNDSNYGPLFPLRKVFDEMENRQIDFWGGSDGYPAYNDVFDMECEFYPYHIRNDFFVVRKKLLHSTVFQDFWNNLGEIKTHIDAVMQLELKMTPYFTEHGFQGAAYMDTSIFSQKDFKQNYAYVYDDAYTLVSKGYPFIKRKAFTSPLYYHLQHGYGDSTRKALDYIDKNTSYDVGLIWEDLLRRQNVTDIRNNLHLNYILPASVRLPGATEAKEALSHKKIAVIAHMFYTELFEQEFEYLKNIPKEFDLIITTKGEENKKKLREGMASLGRDNFRIVEPLDRGREFSALLIACRDLTAKYDYLCFTHDKKTQPNMRHPMIGRTFMETLWEATLASPEYIDNVLLRFEQEPKLGLLSPHCPYHSYFFKTTGNLWSDDYENTVKLAERLGLKCHLSEDKLPFVTGTTFWCRTDALRPLLEYPFEYEDFCPEPMPVCGTISHALERIFPYVAQSRGYYSGVMMPDSYASVWTVNYEYMLSGMVKSFAEENVIFRYSDIELGQKENVINFLKQYKKVYIYGAGDYGRMCYGILRKELPDKLMGFVVSEGHRITGMPCSVFELPEIEPGDDVGIILAMGKGFQKQVLPELRKRGFHNLINFI